ncbi:UDP-N-acetylglucosamine 1-carboxyvinyltransferase [Haloplasma contractile]|uniref:UDP-N-acetylglucosamine 1-carboxyvinyltransferase n=1 Tax=Haloplasma contractile SSD-17B TaxID=1033810 RepID=F7PWN1_9MOLU|nr:UDP-N-acetylglucosamine 1-carboxyvinyltransferase [Haloplasma contractile]ERJ12598.1 UDP-N-acetylglucosamine 1-carboxyvinyltransferase 2 protein [Haloplasma contractile SSD-17B]
MTEKNNYDTIKVIGGKKLNGEVKVASSKNSTVALIPATLLSGEEVILENLPNISDATVQLELLEELGCTVERDDACVKINTKEIKSKPLVGENVTKLRASYYYIGALLTRFKEVEILMPGGCYLGPRPIDLHIKGFEKLGAKVDISQGLVKVKAEKLKGSNIYLDIASVGATINIMLAAVMAEGRTVIENAAKEPEIIDVANLINSMGGKVRGAGTSKIKIDGVTKLGSTRHEIIPDRIEAGTYLIYAAALAEEIKITNIIPMHLESLISKLEEMGVNLEVYKDSILVKESKNLKQINIRTAVYPGFPTDLQQIMVPLLTTKANGVSIITETIYSSRFKNCHELNKMGANIRVENNSAIIVAPKQLYGTLVDAPDLRGGASLILAGLLAEGETTINNVEHIYRGYGDIIEKLTALGATITKA